LADGLSVPKDPPPLLVTPELSSRVIECCKSHQFSAIDLNGRAWLRAPGLLVDRLPLPGRSFSYELESRNIFVGTLLHCDGGSAAAIAAFAEEVRLENPACPDALRTLREHFSSETSPGPVKVGHFILGDMALGESEGIRFERITIRQNMVDAADRLLKKVVR